MGKKLNTPTSPKTLGNAFKALRYYNQHFSKKTGFSASNNTTEINIFSKKNGMKAVNKMSVFNSIEFGRPEDQIRYFAISSLPGAHYIAIFFRRSL
jgi:hypothetical protein